MLSEQISKACDTYIQELHDLGYEPEEASSEGPTPSFEEQLKHVAWMCTRMKSFLEHMDDTEHPDGYPELLAYLKVHTWLGFVQGVLWVQNHKTIRQMRDDNRPKG